jgi:hypothetical protein
MARILIQCWQPDRIAPARPIQAKGRKKVKRLAVAAAVVLGARASTRGQTLSPEDSLKATH